MATEIQDNTAKALREKMLAETEAKITEINKGRKGKGTRLHAGLTRGRSSQVVTWEAFDEGQPETLPTSTQEFLELVKPEEKDIVDYLIRGFNDANYQTASDPIAEYVNPAWKDEVQKQFRIVLRQYSNATGMALEDAAKILRPGIDAAQGTK